MKVPRPDQVVSHFGRGGLLQSPNKVKIGKEHMEQLPQLKFIQLTATGTDNIDKVAAGERGIEVK